MVSLYTSFRLLRLKDYEYNHTADVDCVKTNNKYCCTQYQYSDAKKEYFLNQCTKCENQSRLHKSMQHVDKFLRSYKCLHVSWNLNQPLILLFSNGAIVSLKLNSENNTLLKVEIDETLCGRFLPSRIVDVILCENYIYVSYVESKLSVIHINQDSPNLMAKMLGKKKGKFVGFEPKLINFDLCMQSPKPAERKLSLNKEKELLIVWWKNSGDDVWPWMPITYLTDRLNLFVYSVRNGVLDLLYPVRVQNELLHAAFSKEYSHKFYCLEETRKDQIILTNVCTYEIKEGHCELVHSEQLPVNGHLIAFDWSYSEDKLIASDSTGLLIIYDVKSQSSTVSTLTFKGLPLHIAWHPQTCIALIVCRNNQIFCVDVALNLIDFKLCYKRNSQCGVVDISSFFSSKITVQKVLWQKSVFNDTCLLFLDPEMSSFLLLKLSLGFVTRYNISYLEIISQYLKCSEIDKVKLMYSKLNWEFNYDLKFQCLSKIVNYLLRKPFNSEIECNLEYMLGSFYRWVDHIPDDVVESLEPKMYHLTRRFFHRLLRYNRFEKAWSVAVDLDSQDLFLDLYQLAKQNDENILAAVALHKAEQYELHVSDSCSESCQSDTCSGSVSSSDMEDHDRKSEKWTTFRAMYQEILNQITNKSEDLDDLNRVTKQIEEAVKKLNICPSEELYNNQFTFSTSVPSSVGEQSVAHPFSKYINYPKICSSKPSSPDTPPNRYLEASSFQRYSKYTTTSFCHEDFNSMLQNKNSSPDVSYDSKMQHKSDRNFSLQINKDNLNENCLIDFSEKVCDIPFDPRTHKDLCVSEEQNTYNDTLIKKPSFIGVHEKNTDFSFSNHNFINSKNPVSDKYLSSLHASKQELDKILDISFHQSSDNANIHDFHASYSTFDDPRHETFFHPINTLKNTFENEEPEECVNFDKVQLFPIGKTANLHSAGISAATGLESLNPMQSQSYAALNDVHQVPHSSVQCPRSLESLKYPSTKEKSLKASAKEYCGIVDVSSGSIDSFQPIKSYSSLELSLPKVECRTRSNKPVSATSVSDGIHYASPLVLHPFYKDGFCDNDKQNYRNSLSQDYISNSSISSSLKTLKNECCSSNILDNSHKLLSSNDNRVKMSQSEQHNDFIKYISSSTESPIHAYSHHLSSIICDTQHSFSVCNNECSVAEDESEEMDGTKIKLDHLGVI